MPLTCLVFLSLSMCVVSMNRLDEPCPSFLTALTQRARGELRGFSPQHLANSLNAMARLKHDPGKDFMHECMVSTHTHDQR